MPDYYPAYCEVALPVPLDRTFTYAVQAGQVPVRGSRVIVPFRNEKLIGIVMSVGGEPAADYEIRSLEAVLDSDQDEGDGPLLSEELLKLAEWMAGYYLAPLGEVLRGMLPLVAEVKRTVYYRITDAGRDALARMWKLTRNSIPQGLKPLFSMWVSMPGLKPQPIEWKTRLRGVVRKSSPKLNRRSGRLRRTPPSCKGACWSGSPKASR